MAQGVNGRIRNRALGLLALLLALGFGAAIVSLVRWQLVRGEEMRTRAVNQSLESAALTPMRGRILDASGTKVLAQSASVWTVVLEPNYLTLREDGETPEQVVTRRRKIAAGLAQILGMDEEEVFEKTGENSYFSYLKRRVESDVREKILAFLDENDIGSGVRLIPDYKRYYPYGTLASNLLGFTGYDAQGLEGLELYYDKELSGTAGRLVSAKNALGTDMPFEYEQYNDAKNGNDLVLTVDETVQSILEKYLAEGIKKFKVNNGGVAIMMNVRTGAILGLATHPNYDPNEPFTILDETLLQSIAALPEAQRDDAETDAYNKQWRNKAVSDTYYPGSVFKMCTYAMALEEGAASLDTTFFCSGEMVVDEAADAIHCWKHEGHGSETFAQGLYNSCNPWAIFLGQQMGAEIFCKYREAFGFTEQTGIDLPGESTGIYHSLEDMGPVELATETFGQNFSVTPVQMITAAAAIANGGYLVQPHVVDRIVDSDGNVVSSAETATRRQVISESTSKAITEILRFNAQGGTATGGYVAGYRVCGKTGTSEKVQKNNEDKAKYAEDPEHNPEPVMQYIASYCGFAPAEDPQYALLVFFDEPDREYNAANGIQIGGNSVAGPVFSQIMGEALPYLGVEPNYTEEEYANLDLVTPTVVGLTLEEAQKALEGQGLESSVIGTEEEGTVVSAQIPAAGEPVPRAGKVILYTSDFTEDEALTEVPDLTGMDLTNAAYAAALNDLQISVAGAVSDSATVTMQDLSPGLQVRRGTVITVTFSDSVDTETFYH